MSDQTPPLLIPRLAADDEAMRIGLPSLRDNLFARIISNPAPTGLLPRERACTEMLCGVLRSAPALRGHLLRALALAARANLPLDVEDLEYELQTERSVPGGQRDDLRIEAWSDSERTDRVLLWSVEVKVGAAFHASAGAPETAQGGAGEEQECPPPKPELENQLLHYDRWLRQERAQSVCGFVLCRCSSMKEAFPEGLQRPWQCLTWTWLGLTIEAALTRELPAEENFLGRHVAGFIRSYLWNEEEAVMDDAARIDIDDIALIRAFGSFGNATKQKVDALLEPLPKLLADAELGLGPTEFNRSLFKPSARTIGYGSLFDKTNQAPWLCAGVVTQGGTDLAVWIETSAKFKLKGELHRALGTALSSLNARAEPRRARWTLLEPREGSPRDLEIRVPFERLLAEDDQAAAASAFFVAALDDLKACKVLSIVASAIGADVPTTSAAPS